MIAYEKYHQQLVNERPQNERTELCIVTPIITFVTQQPHSLLNLKISKTHNTTKNHTSAIATEQRVEKNMSDQEDWRLEGAEGSSIMDLACFLSTELTMVRMNNAQPTVKDASKSERHSPRRSQAKGVGKKIESFFDSRRRQQRDSLFSLRRDSFDASVSSMETVIISNLQEGRGDHMDAATKDHFELSASKNSNLPPFFEIKNLDELSVLMNLPPRESRSPPARRSQSNNAA